MSNRKRPVGRAAVIDMLADHHPGLSDFTRRPWRLHHLDGSPFTAGESKLANSATLAELQAAQKIAMAAERQYRGKHAGLIRAQELLQPHSFGDDDDIADVVARMPPGPQRDEVEALIRRYPDELGPAGGGEEDD